MKHLWLVLLCTLTQQLGAANVAAATAAAGSAEKDTKTVQEDLYQKSMPLRLTDNPDVNAVFEMLQKSTALLRTLENRVLQAWDELSDSQAPAVIAAIQTIQQGMQQGPISQTMQDYFIPELDDLINTAFGKAEQEAVDSLYVECGSSLTKILAKYPVQEKEYRAIRKKGTPFPLSNEVLGLWEKGNFERAPTLVYPANLHCKECDRYVRFPRWWMMPQYYHDLTKHSGNFLAVLEERESKLKYIKYGHDIPRANQRRALLHYLLCHIDAHINAKNPYVTALGGPQKKSLSDAEWAWLKAGGTFEQVYAWTFFARYLANPEWFEKTANPGKGSPAK